MTSYDQQSEQPLPEIIRKSRERLARSYELLKQTNELVRQSRKTLGLPPGEGEPAQKPSDSAKKSDLSEGF